MKLLFIATASALLLANPAVAEISEDIKKTCMQAQDFLGCVKALSGGSELDQQNELQALRNAMKQVASRIDSGISFKNSTSIFQPLIDELAIAAEAHPDSLAVKSSTKARELFKYAQSYWESKIFYPGINVSARLDLAKFNLAVGSEVVKPIGGKNWVDKYEQGAALRQMIFFVSGVLEEGAVDPNKIEEYENNRAEELRLANLGPWQKHLEQNPGLAQWAAANPAAAEKSKAKFIAKNPQQTVSIPTYSETLKYLSKFNPPL